MLPTVAEPRKFGSSLPNEPPRGRPRIKREVRDLIGEISRDKPLRVDTDGLFRSTFEPLKLYNHASERTALN